MERCRIADKLALVPTPEGLLALLAGTEDPHLDVEEVCIRNLGRLADPATLPVLIEGMIKAIEGHSRLSVRHLKTALVQFPLEEVDALRADPPSWETDARALEAVHRRSAPRALKVLPLATDEDSGPKTATETKGHLLHRGHHGDALDLIQQLLRNIVMDIQNFPHNHGALLQPFFFLALGVGQGGY